MEVEHKFKTRFLLKPSNRKDDDGLYYSATLGKKKLKEAHSSILDHSYFSLEAPKDRAAMLLEVRELPLTLDFILSVCIDWPKEANE